MPWTNDSSIQPNNPKFYEPAESFPTLNALIGTPQPKNEEDQEVYLQSIENFGAFLQTLMPQEIEDREKTIDLLTKLDPSFRVPSDHRERAELSRQMREELLSFAKEDFYFNTDSLAAGGINDRTFFVLLERSENGNISERNAEIVNTIINGSAREKGLLFEERINKALDWFRRAKDVDLVSDQELLTNMREIFAANDIVTNAQNMLAAHDAGRIELSEDALKTVNEMLLGATRMDMFMQRVKIIANPIYELMDPVKASFFSVDRLEAFTDIAEEQDRTSYDFIKTISTYATERYTDARDVLLPMVAQDFDLKKELPTLYMVNSQGSLQPLLYDDDQMSGVFPRILGISNIVAMSSDGTTALYRVDKYGHVARGTAQELGEDFVNSAREGLGLALQGLKEANRGLFIGSSYYSNAYNSMEDLFDAFHKCATPPTEEDLERMRPLLENVVNACMDYIAYKQEGQLDPEKPQFKNAREGKRFNAVSFAQETCRKYLNMLHLQSLSTDVERDAALTFRSNAKDVEYPIHSHRELNESISRYNTTYMEGGQAVLNKIPAASNLLENSEVARELCADIHTSLNKLFDHSSVNYNDGDAREVMGKMVLLEMIKKGRTIGENNEILAGPIEKALAADPQGFINSFRQDPTFLRMTENLNYDMMRHFVCTNGASTMADRMLKNSLQAGVSENADAPKLENVPIMG